MTLKGTTSNTEETKVDNWSIHNNAVVKNPLTETFISTFGPPPPATYPSFRMEIKGYRVNELPTSENETVSANEDEAYAFKVADFNFADDDAFTEDSLQRVKIVTLPANGTLALDGSAIASGDLPKEVKSADIEGLR